MNFSKLLSKEIDRKRKNPPPAAKKKPRYEKHVSAVAENVAAPEADAKVAAGVAPDVAKDVAPGVAKDVAPGVAKDVDPGVAPSVAPSVAPDFAKDVAKDSVTAANVSANVAAATNPAAPSLNSISDEKLSRSIARLDPHPESLSKHDQLHKLEILVRREKKNARYSHYLALEDNVAVAIDLNDIGAASSDDVARRLSMQVRKFIKHIIRNWQSDPASAHQMSLLDETKRDVVRLMYKLRSGKLAPDVLVSLCTIVYYIQTESFAKANEAYMKLSIGNVAWPIGVRDVGIHARAADAKITGDDKTSVANIMQNEKTRRWIIAVKRLLNYCEHAHTQA